MKKLILAAVLAASAAAFAALDFEAARAIPVKTSAQSVSAGATNTTTVTLGGLRGLPELFVIANGNTSRTALDIMLWTTNKVSGGYMLYAGERVTNTNAGVYRVVFPGEYISNPAQVRVGSIGAATSFTAFILSY